MLSKEISGSKMHTRLLIVMSGFSRILLQVKLLKVLNIQCNMRCGNYNIIW